MFVGDMVCIKKISTHTLTWSVTNLSCCFLRAFAISTHTLTWSVTSSLNVISPVSNDFNSHAHVERDKATGSITFSYFISTHTLTWSVTWELRSHLLWQVHFNSHAHVERDRQ